MQVLELGSTVAGPFCGRMLADFGAEVIKIEPPEGDAVRTMGKQFAGKSLYAASIFRNKQLVCIDLNRPEGRAIAREIALTCDVVVENFKPGTMEAWGLGWNELSRANPRLVMVRISGFGQDGPYAARPGYGVICEAVSGIRHLTGDPDRPPSRVAVSMTDYITGLHGAFGAVMALMARGKHRPRPVRRRRALRVRLQFHGALDPGLRQAGAHRRTHRLAPRWQQPQQSLSHR